MQGRRLEKTGGVAITPPAQVPRRTPSRGNTSRFFWGRERCRCLQIVCRSRMALLGRTCYERKLSISSFMAR